MLSTLAKLGAVLTALASIMIGLIFVSSALTRAGFYDRCKHAETHTMESENGRGKYYHSIAQKVEIALATDEDLQDNLWDSGFSPEELINKDLLPEKDTSAEPTSNAQPKEMATQDDEPTDKDQPPVEEGIEDESAPWEDEATPTTPPLGDDISHAEEESNTDR